MARGGRPGIRPEYDRRIVELLEEGLTIEEIFQQLGKGTHVDGPSFATIRNRAAKHRKKPLEDRLLDAPFLWPQSMMKGREGDQIPWEAGATCMELLRFRDSKGLPRPSNRVTLWYYRVRLAAPDLDTEQVNHIAGQLASGVMVDITGGCNGHS